MMMRILVSASLAAAVLAARVDDDQAPAQAQQAQAEAEAAEAQAQADAAQDSEEEELTPEEEAQAISANRKVDTYLAAKSAHDHVEGAAKLSGLVRGQLLKESGKHSVNHVKTSKEQFDSLGNALKAHNRHKHIASRAEAVAAYKARVDEELVAATDNLALKERREEEAIQAAVGAAASEQAARKHWQEMDASAGEALAHKKGAEANFEGKAEAMELAAADADEKQDVAKRRALELKLAGEIETRKASAKEEADGIKHAADTASAKAQAKGMQANAKHKHDKFAAQVATEKKVAHIQRANMYAEKDIEAADDLVKAGHLVEDLTVDMEHMAKKHAKAKKAAAAASHSARAHKAIKDKAALDKQIAAIRMDTAQEEEEEPVQEQGEDGEEVEAAE